MKKAIITGASGLVGRSVTAFLISRGVDVLCIGRRNLDPDYIHRYLGEGVNYIQLSAEDISSLRKKIINRNWIVGNDCVFYNFAWAGINNLTDGRLDDQMQNAISSALAVKVAQDLGCSKFINSGTMEETYALSHLRSGTPSLSSQCNYAIAKLACRDMCSMVAYLQKIDYIHTRLSVPLSANLEGNGFIARNLKKIKNKEDYERAQNKQLYDVIHTDDVARAYYLIGLYGKNKADYFIGSGFPTTLDDFFKNFRRASLGQPLEHKSYSSLGDLSLFSTELLASDTGFVARSNVFRSMHVGNSK